MCERNSYLEAALNYQCHNGVEEMNDSSCDNSKYWNSDDNMLTSTNKELLSYVQTTNCISDYKNVDMSCHVEVDVGNCNRNANNCVSSSLRNSTSSTSTAPQSSSSIGVNLRVTGQCSQGGRKYMEDYFSVAYQQSENTKDLEYAFVGIYDGHGGADAAIFAKEHLMMEIINQKLFWSDSDQDVLRAIREGYIATHYAMWREQDKWPKTARGLLSTAGTTATIAFIRREKLYIGHVGDSGIVLGYQNEDETFWRAKPLTTDHKPESADERNRIMRAGGKVVVKSGVPRVVWNRPRLAGHRGPVRRSTPIDEIPFLAVARSLGDLWSYNSELNEFVVSPDPDVKVIKINPKTFRCLIFGTDGLWNVVSPQEAVDCVYDKELVNEQLQELRGELSPDNTNGQWTNPSKGLVKKALKTWSSKKMRADNTSVVTVILYPPGKNVADNTPSCHTQSYGLEYTQVNAEIPTYDDSTSYAELANKYLPPEEYRNFKYDDVESEEVLVDPLEPQYSPYLMQNYGAYQPVMLASGHDYYDPLAVPQTPCEHVVNGSTDEESDVDDREEEDDDLEDDCVERSNIHSSLPNFGIDQYPQRYRQQPQHMEQIAQMPTRIMEQESLDYMDSFAESYTDSLLNGHAEETIMDTNSNHAMCQVSDSRCSDTTSSSNSSSTSSYHNAIFQHNLAHQQQLLMEHQQYQEQCMSQEEGYSLTKLETRGEQQMRNESSNSGDRWRQAGGGGGKEVETFKIFQKHALEESSLNVNATTDSCDAHNNTAASRDSLWDLRYPALNRYMQSYVPPKLELNSLLQQEIEEEQQVAIERLELQRHADLQLQQAQQSLADQEFQELEETISADYLVEEDATMALDSSYEETPADISDATIQINEISSSIESPAAFEELLEMEVEPVNTTMEQQDDQHMSCSSSSSRSGSSSSKPKQIVIIEKIEILHKKPDFDPLEPLLAMSNSSPTLPSHIQTTQRIRLSRTRTSYPISSKQPTKALINPSPSKRTLHYPNVPNENQRLSSMSTSSSRSQRRCDTSPYNALQQQRSEKRQLRSMAPPAMIDYAKRTLRSRNSLSKDMKAKSTLNLRRSTPMSNQFMRTTAATLLATNVAVQQQQQQQQQQQEELHQSPKLTSNKAAVLQLQLPLTSSKSAHISEAHSAHAINLRSRQVLPTTLSTPPTQQALEVIGTRAGTVANSSSFNQLQQRRERRSLRNLSTKSSTNCVLNSSRDRSATVIFSKATRLQSTAANLAAPPPSPKLIYASTRARSMLTPKTTVANIPLEYGKRSNLRSSTNINVSATSSSGTLLTRSRVQKRMNQ